MSVALDIADKAIKAAAVAIGGLWTFWNYKRSRPYAQKLDLLLTGSVFGRGNLFIDITATIKNVGGSRQLIEQQGTFCELVAVLADLSEESVMAFPVFQEHRAIEPGVTITDRLQWKVNRHPNEIVWFKLYLRVISGDGLEWSYKTVVRAREEDIWSTSLGL